MSYKGQHQSGGVQAFSKSKASGSAPSLGSFAIQAVGAICSMVAVLTALTPAPHEALTFMSRQLDRLGLDLPRRLRLAKGLSQMQCHLSPTSPCNIRT